MDTQIQIAVIIKDKGGKMELTKEQMREIKGGAISSAVLNAISKAITTIYELGKNTGSAIRRLYKKTYCPAN